MTPSAITHANDWARCQATEVGSVGGQQAERTSRMRTYHVETRLPHGKPALLLDVVSVVNLVGDEWVRQQAVAAMRAGLKPEQRRRERPLTVRGVCK